MKKLEFDNSQIHFLPFGRGTEDRDLALLMAEITMNWGRLEYWLYLILEAIDPRRAEEWTRKFFSTTQRRQREATVRSEVGALFDGYPEFFVALNKVLEDLESVCWRRNVVAHGLWKSIEAGKYQISPLHFDKSSGSFGVTVEFDSFEATKILNLMRKVINQLATLSLEVRAGSFLKANQERINKAKRKRT